VGGLIHVVAKTMELNLVFDYVEDYESRPGIVVSLLSDSSRVYYHLGTIGQPSGCLIRYAMDWISISEYRRVMRMPYETNFV
jgi:hypothetical protein